MKSNWKIILLALICFVLGTSEFVIVGVLDKIALSSNITIAQAGQLITVFAITVAVATPIVIYFISGINLKTILVASLACFATACVMMIASPNYPLLLLSRVVMAVGVGVFNVVCFIVASNVASPGKKSGAIATVSLGFNAALIIGLPVGRIVTHLYGWKSLFIFTGTFAIAALVAILYMIPSIDGEKRTSFRDQLRLIRKPVIVLSFLMSLFWITGYSLFYTYVTPYLQHTSSMSEQLLTITFLIFGFATLAGNRLGGYLGDRIGITQTILLSLVVNVCALVMLSALSGFVYATMSILVIWGIAAWTPGPLFRYNSIALAPGSPGVILSLYNSITQMGMAIGAAFGGFVFEHSAPITLSWTAAGMILMSLVFAFLFARKTLRKTEIVIESNATA